MKLLYSFYTFLLFAFFNLFLGTEIALANVTITPASNGQNISADLSQGSAGAAFTTLGDFVIAENLNTDFALNQTAKTFVIQLPANWQFRVGAGSVSFAGSKITGASLTVASTSLTVTFSTNAVSSSNNAITISGLQVQAATGKALVLANILKSGGTGIIAGFPNNTVCGTLSQVAGAYVKLQALLPGEVASPGTALGKTGSPNNVNPSTNFYLTVNAVDQFWNKVNTVNNGIGYSSSDPFYYVGYPNGLVSGNRNVPAYLKTVGPQTITVTDLNNGGISPASTANVTVNAGVFSKLQILLPGETAAPGTASGKTGTPVPQIAGAPFSVTVNAVDASWNKITTAPNDQIRLSSTDANATMPSNAGLNTGSLTFSVTLITSGSRQLTATDLTDGSKTANSSPSFSLNAGAYVKLQVLLPGESAASGTTLGKTGVTTNTNPGTGFYITVNAVDQYWNKVSSINNSLNYSSSDPLFSVSSPNGLVSGNRNVPAILKTPGYQTITVTDAINGGISPSISASILVNGGVFTKLQILLPGETAAPGTALGKTGTAIAQVAGTPISVIVNAVDASWNLIPTAPNNQIRLTSTDPYATMPSNASLTGGTVTFSVTLITGTLRQLTATNITDGSKTANISPLFTVNGGSYVKLQLLLPGETASPGSLTGKTGTPTNQTAGTGFYLTVNAVDQYWNKVTTINNSLGYSSSDPLFSVSSPNGLVSGNRNVPVILNTTGLQTITVTDLNNNGITPSQSASVLVNFSRPTDYFRSVTSGIWANKTSWESAPDNVTWTPATLAPGNLAASIVIQSGHNITSNSDLTIPGVTISAGAQLDLGVNQLTVSGSAGTNGAGTLLTQNTSASPISTGKTWSGTVNYNASGAQTVSAGDYTNLTAAGSGTKSLINTVNVSGVINVSTPATVNSSGYLTLLATATTNANVAPLLGSADISGNVNVQSYIYGEPSGATRGTKTMSSPINDALVGGSKTYAQLKNYMIITGPRAASNGFDVGGGIAPEAVTINTYYEPASTNAASFVPVPTLNTANVPGNGFLFFFRGNRSNISQKYVSPFPSAEDVLLTFTGPINKKDIDVAVSYTNYGKSVDGNFLAGNPYPATIDWQAVNAASANIGTSIVIVTEGKPNATYNITGNVATNGGSRYIQPGQGFYVQAGSGGGTLKFRESQKNIVASPARLLSAPQLNSRITLNGQRSSIKESSTNLDKSLVSQSLRLSLEKGTFKEEALVLFNDNYQEEADLSDSKYIPGYSINLATLSSDGQPLSINLTKKAQSQIKLDVNSDTNGEMKFSILNLQELGNRRVFLTDNYLKKVIEITDYQNSYSFNVDLDNISTFGDSRLSLTLEDNLGNNSLTQPNGFTVYPNPVADILNIEVSQSQSLGGANLSLTVFDMNGKKVLSKISKKGEKVFCDVGNLANGYYLLEVKTVGSSASLGRTKFIKK